MGQSQSPGQIDFQGDKLLVTKHALERFLERFAAIDSNAVSLMKKPLLTIKRLLQRSEKTEIDPKFRLMRLLNNHCCLAEYWVNPNTGLRFVIVDSRTDEGKVLVTVELPERAELKPFRGGY